MGRGQHDPLKDFLVDLFSSEKTTGQPGKTEKPAVGKYSAIAPFIIIATAFAFYAPRIVELTGQAPESQGAIAAVTIHGYRWLLLLATLALIAFDVVRFISHRHRVRLDAHVRQATRHLPVKVTVGFPPGISALRSAKIKLPCGAIIRPKEMDEFTSAVRASVNR